MDVTKSMIWVGTNNGVSTVSISQERVVDHYTTEDGILESNEINFIHSDSYGVRWIGTNAGAVKLWQDLGFEIIGTLPKAFNHRQKGFVDAFVMYQWLGEK